MRKVLGKSGRSRCTWNNSCMTIKPPLSWNKPVYRYLCAEEIRDIVHTIPFADFYWIESPHENSDLRPKRPSTVFASPDRNRGAISL